MKAVKIHDTHCHYLALFSFQVAVDRYCVRLTCLNVLFFSSWLWKKNFSSVVFLTWLQIICFLCCSCLQNITYKCCSCSFFSLSVLSASWFLTSLAAQIAFILCRCSIFHTFQIQRQHRNFKNVQWTPGQCPTSMDTTDACSLIPRNVNCLTVRPVSICGLGNLSVLRQCPWQSFHKADFDLATDDFRVHQTKHSFPLGALVLMFKLLSWL